MNPQDIVWEDPPPGNEGHKRTYPRELPDLIKASPGRWAKLAKYKNPNSASATAARFKLQGFEAVSRGAVVYLRWPEDSAA